VIGLIPSAITHRTRPANETRRRIDGLVSAAVYGAWAALTISLLWLVATCADNIPGPDEWKTVPILTGQVPLTWAYVFSRHGEHVLPLSRTLLVLLARVFGLDFRAGMVASVFVLSAAALALIRTSGYLRGRLSLADLLLPLLLLHFGHRQNLLQGWNVHNVLFSATAIALLILILVAGEGLTRSIGLGAVLILLPFTGAAGYTISLVMSIWFLVTCFLARRSPDPRQRFAGTIGAALALVSLGICRLLLRFNHTALEAIGPWLVFLLGGMLLSRLLRSTALRIITWLITFGLAATVAWLIGLDEAAYLALAISIAVFGAARGFVRYRDRTPSAQLDGSMIMGLALAMLLAIVKFRRPDKESLMMVAGCATVALAVWSALRIRKTSGQIGMVAAIVILSTITIGSNRISGAPVQGILGLLRGAVMFLSTGFGMTAGYHWPSSGYAIVLLWLAAPVLLMRSALVSGGRLPVGGLLAYWLAFTALALAVGWGRSGNDPKFCLEPRYGILSLPFLCAVYLIMGLTLPPLTAKIGRFLFCSLIVFWSADNFTHGWLDARWYHEKNERFLADMNTGKPLMYLIYRHRWWIPMPWSSYLYTDMETGMRSLHDANHTGFAKISLDWPELDRVIVFQRGNPEAVGPHYHAKVEEGSIAIHMDQGMHVLAVLAYFEPRGHQAGWRPSTVKIHWPNGPALADSVELTGFQYDRMATAWVHQKIDHFTVDWSPADSLRPSQIACFVPASATPAYLRLRNPFFVDYSMFKR
jgi:hypothetical protein